MKKITLLITVCLFTISIYAQLTWNLNNPKLGYETLNEIFFVDDNSGWVLSNKSDNNKYTSIVYHTNNGGGEWAKQFDQEVTSDERLSGLFFINAQKGWIVGGSGVILSTSNAGNTWNKSYLPLNADLYKVFFINENKGWVVGNFEGIFFTTDGGSSWEFTDDGTHVAHSDVYFFNDQTGIALGFNYDNDNSRILKSTDGGISWSTKYLFDDGDLYSLFFIDDDYGWAVGYNGSIIHTTNGGENWVVQESNVGWWFWEVRFVSQSKGSICGDDGFLYTSDGGNTWTETTISDTEFMGLCFASQNKGYAVGKSTGWEAMGAFYTTNDGGATWENGNARAAYMKKICTLDENTLVAVGGDYHFNEIPCVMTSTDQGNTWSYKELGAWDYSLTSVCFNSGTGY